MNEEETTINSCSLFPPLGNSENVLGRVRSITKNIEGERRDVPTLNRLSARDRWDTKESEAMGLYRLVAKVSIPEIPSTPAGRLTGR